MRKGRFFRRRFRFDPDIEHLRNTSLNPAGWHDQFDETIHRLRHHGRHLRSQLEATTREHPMATLLAAGAVTGLLIWALLRRPAGHRRVEGLERLEHW